MTSPQILLHGDPHIGNTYVLPVDKLPSAEDVLLRYRAPVAHGLAIWMATLSGGDAWQSPEICVASAQRYAAAYMDLDTPAAIDAIA
jgi:hypothetical protein